MCYLHINKKFLNSPKSLKCIKNYKPCSLGWNSSKHILGKWNHDLKVVRNDDFTNDFIYPSILHRKSTLIQPFSIIEMLSKQVFISNPLFPWYLICTTKGPWPNFGTTRQALGSSSRNMNAELAPLLWHNPPANPQLRRPHTHHYVGSSFAIYTTTWAFAETHYKPQHSRFVGLRSLSTKPQAWSPCSTVLDISRVQICVASTLRSTS